MTALDEAMEILKRVHSGDEIGVSTDHYKLFIKATEEYNAIKKIIGAQQLGEESAMIKPKCSICKKELKSFGALLFSPPKQNMVKKYHICKKCFKLFIVKGRVK